MASYRGRRRAPARAKLAKDQQELDYGSIEIITADDFKEGAVAELTPPGAQDALSGGTDSYTRTPSAYETLMPAALPVEDAVQEKAALQPQYVQPRQTPARKKTPLPKPATPVNEYGRTPSAEIRLAPVARKQTPVPPQQNLAAAVPAPLAPAPAVKPAVAIPVAKPVTAPAIDDTEITKVHSVANDSAGENAELKTARAESSDDYGIEEINSEDVVLEAAPSTEAQPIQPVFDRLHSDDDGDDCSAVAIPKLDELDQRQIETEELPVLTAPREKRASILFVPLVLVLGICLGYMAGTWQNYLPFYSALMHDLFPAQTALDLEEAAPRVDAE